MRPPAVILAGGQSRRMGSDKARIRLGDRSLLGHVLHRLTPQCGPIALSAPAPIGGLPCLPDPEPGGLGPLAGLLAAMLWARDLGHAHVLTAPVDTPFLPPDLAARLSQHPGGAIAASDRAHPVIGLWPVARADDLRARIRAGDRRIGLFGRDAARVVWSDSPDPFFNVNTPRDLQTAHARL